MNFQPSLFPREQLQAAQAPLPKISYNEVHLLHSSDKLVDAAAFTRWYQAKFGTNIAAYLGSLRQARLTASKLPRLWLKQLDEPLLSGVHRWKVRYYLGVGTFGCELTWLAHDNVKTGRDLG